MNEKSETLSSSALTPDQIVAEYAKCAADFWYFVTHYGYISDPARGTIPFEPWPHFEQIARHALKNDRIIILKARQIGVSWLFVFFALWYALFRPNSNILVISIRQIESTHFKWRVKFAFRNLPEWLQVDVGKDNDELLEFPTLDSSIHSLPATEDSGRSSTANLVILDEWAFQEYARSIYTAILPTVERGKLIGISTANGKNNLYYDLWVAAKNKQNTFLPLFVPYSMRPGRDKDWWDTTAANMGSIEEAMREYPDDEADAFTVMSEAYFDKDALNAVTPTDGTPWGNYSNIWKAPVAGERYVAGIDPAPGGGDHSVLQILSESGEQVARTSTNDDIDRFAKEAYGLLEHYGYPHCNPERQGEGNTLIRLFLQWGYPEHKIYHSSANQPGWYTTRHNREDVLAELRAAIRDRRVSLHHERTVTELRGFGYNEKGRLEGIYGHDDEVMALALAWYMQQTAPKPINADEWKPREYMQMDSSPRSIAGLDWRKADPLLCTYILRDEDGHKIRRCGVRHSKAEDLAACPHL